MGRPKPQPRPREPFESTGLGRAYRKVTGTAGNPYAAGSRGRRTWIQYASSIRLFEGWCARHGLQAMPATTEVLIRYLVHLADEGYAYQTVCTYLNGLCAWHDAAGRPIDRRPLHATMKGIKRTAPRSRQAAALVLSDLLGILDTLQPGTLRDVRDGALLCVMFGGALRPSEAAGLDWMTCRDGTGTLRLTDRGIRITIHESKTSPTEDQEVPPIPAADAPDAVAWLKLWVKVADIEAGTPLFRPIGRSGRAMACRMASKSLSGIVRARIRQLATAGGATPGRALMRAMPYSGHSARHGLGTSQARAGVQEWRIRQRMRHKSPTTTARYIQAVETWTDTGLSRTRIARSEDRHDGT